MTAWQDYWHTLPHGSLLFEPEADEFARNLLATNVINVSDRLLDYGCGYGTVAARIAPNVRELEYWDAAPSMNTAATQSLKATTNTAAWDEARGGFDAILVNSVVQYMNAEALTERLTEWQTFLSPHGRVILADLIPSHHSTLADMRDLFLFSVRRGYFVTAVRKTLAERSRYNAVAKTAPLFRVEPAWLERTAKDLGFSLLWLPRNLSHFRSRKTAVLERA